MQRRNCFFILLLTLVFSSAHADGSVKNYNQISLDASSSAEVDNDTMTVSMYVLEEGSRTPELVNKVNTKINRALQNLKAYKSIKVRTQNYSTSPVYNKNQIIAWRVRQSIQLESKDMPLLSKVTGDLQTQLKLDGISFDVSREKRQQQTEVLIDQAIAAFNKRAMQVTKKLRHDGYKIVTMRVSAPADFIRYRQRSAGMAMAEAKVAPVFSAGDRTLTVKVSGTIELE